MIQGAGLVLSCLLLRFEQLPAISFRIQPNTQVFVPLDLISPLAEVAKPFRKLNAIDFQIRAKPITAGFGQFVARHWLPVFAENFQALQLA